ncbi:MAG: DUF2249 domain-containing protein [Jhaorihella sp.]
MTDSAPTATIVDLRPMMPPQRHATVFAAIEALADGESFVLINDHAPIPLLMRIDDQYPDRFEWAYLVDGPTEWQVSITRLRD